MPVPVQHEWAWKGSLLESDFLTFATGFSLSIAMTLATVIY